MTSIVRQVAFDYSQANVNWFPSHMARGLQDMERRIKGLNLVLEVRDARIPLSSGNPLLEKMIAKIEAKHVIVLNKADLANDEATRVLKPF